MSRTWHGTPSRQRYMPRIHRTKPRTSSKNFQIWTNIARTASLLPIMITTSSPSSQPVRLQQRWTCRSRAASPAPLLPPPATGRRRRRRLVADSQKTAASLRVRAIAAESEQASPLPEVPRHTPSARTFLIQTEFLPPAALLVHRSLRHCSPRRRRRRRRCSPTTSPSTSCSR